MNSADERVAELLRRWLASLELHARYLDLDDATYARAQDWPKHQRPARWVVELAHTRLLELKRRLAERDAQGDAGFAEALELMSFLTTLLGSEHIDRFIPLAKPKGSPSASARSATARPSVATPSTVRPPRTPAPAGRAAPAAVAPRQRTAARDPRRSPPAGGMAPEVPDKLAATVVADAVRFMRWGREWPQLAGLIARLADRPAEPQIWEILRKHRADIEAQAKRPPD